MANSKKEIQARLSGHSTTKTEIGDDQVTIVDRVALSSAWIDGFCAAHHSAAVPVRYLIIDYIQLMRGERDGLDIDRKKEIDWILRDLKRIAIYYNCAVLTITRTRAKIDSFYSHEVNLQILREHSSMQLYADFIFLLHYEPFKGKSRDKAVRSISLVLNRFGPCRRKFLRLDAGSFSEFHRRGI